MNNNERTLIILTPGFPKDESDSTCLPMQQQLIKAWKEIDPALNIVILSFQYPYHKKPYSWFGIKVIPFNGRNRGGLAKHILRIKVNVALKKIHGQTPITGLLSFWYGECALVGSRFANKHRLKHYCWLLGQDAKKDNKYPRRIALASGEIIALSNFLADEFNTNHHINPAHLVTAGINTKLYFTQASEKNIDILATGSLIQLKRYDLFIEIIAEVKKEIPGINAVLIGNGPEIDNLKNLIHLRGLDHTVTLTGELPYPDTIQQMQLAKVFLHPSSYEGFSGVCLEALYAGAHVISFCKAMNQEIEHWHIVQSKLEMVQTAVSILNNPASAYTRVAFSTIENTAQKMKALFSE